MKQETNHIHCPNCGEEIDVNEILYHQLDEELKKKYKNDLAKEKQKYSDKERELDVAHEALEQDKAAYREKLGKEVRKAVQKQKSQIESEIRKNVEQDLSERIESLQSELKDKSEKVKELNQTKTEIERLKREKDTLRDTIELETQQKLNIQIAEARERIKKSEESKTKLQLVEREQVINQLRDQLQDAQRKAEQGSIQLQGEVQELAIEEWLGAQFPLDTIEEIKKGAHGADCLQIVNTRSHQNCGSIYYESKRTKTFQPIWIEKFKTDIRNKNANIGVLVTETMPADMERLGLRDGVWICSFDEFRGLCVVLRESIIQISNAISVTENKGDKMGMLYDFLTGNEFRLQIEAIVEGFTQMQLDLDSEKRAIQGIWKKREKQIEKVLLNTNHMYNSIRGIAGNAVQALPQLELPLSDDTDTE